MTYATRLGLESRYGAIIGQRDSALPPGGLERVLADTDAELHAYLATRYALPLAPVPPEIELAAYRVAYYRLLGDAATEMARADYDATLRMLRDVRDGRQTLTGLAPLAVAADVATVEFSTAPAVFRRRRGGRAC